MVRDGGDTSTYPRSSFQIRVSSKHITSRDALQTRLLQLHLTSHLSSSLLPLYLQIFKNQGSRVILSYYFFCNPSCDLSTLLDSDLAKATYTSAVLLASQGQPVTISDSESEKACVIGRVFTSRSSQGSSEQTNSTSHTHLHDVKSSQPHRHSARDNQCRYSESPSCHLPTHLITDPSSQMKSLSMIAKFASGA